ncbi:MAG: hypothetical protein LC117_05695 [Bacteroidia bacterium]|nr:hypothetical protein [Bacteroidia bacterium]MCZ2277404.1 hypothetical protein [Bacteroidia bacterium]
MAIGEKQLGIWLDRHKARFVEFKNDEITIQTIESGYDRYERVEGMGATGSRFGSYSTNNENRKSNRLQTILNSYYKLISDRIVGYDHVVLIGPSTGKNELFNYLRDNKQLAKVRIEIQNCDNLTDNQLKAFVREYFNRVS